MGETGWRSFLNENASAVIALAGVALGSILTGLVSLAAQAQQQRWALRQHQREWRQARRREQFDSVVEWQNQWLRAASRVIQLEETLAEAKSRRRRADKTELSALLEAATTKAEALRDMTPPVGPLIRSIQDTELSRLYYQFRESIAQYQPLVEARNPSEASAANKALFERIEALVADTQRRIDQLLEVIPG